LDVRLYVTVAAVLLCAAALAALLARDSWRNTSQSPRRFLGLDEPAAGVRTGR
jgi:hypothetical protein